MMFLLLHGFNIHGKVYNHCISYYVSAYMLINILYTYNVSKHPQPPYYTFPARKEHIMWNVHSGKYNTCMEKYATNVYNNEYTLVLYSYTLCHFRKSKRISTMRM